MTAEDNKSTSTDAPTAPALPPDFWSQLEIQQACRERHFGHLLKSYRELQNPPIKQSELAVLLSLTQGQISRIERSRNPVTDLQKLATWAEIIGIPESILWFKVQHEREKSRPQSPAASTISGESCSEGDEDVRRRDLMKSIGIGATLVSTSGIEDTLSTAAGTSSAIGTESVDIMRMYVQTFRRIDNSYGGGHSLPKIGEYLRNEVVPMINSASSRAKVREQLFATAAELYQLAGWSAYDSGKSELGRKSLSRAIQLCQQIGHKAYVAELLAGLSHQHSFMRSPNDAVDFAIAAKETASKVGIPALDAEASVMAAHGYAQLGDKRACMAELQNAETEFCRIRTGETPDWLNYFDEAYLSAKFGHALKDLGESTQAERFARRSLDMTEGYERGRMFNTALLASTLADQGQVAEATEQGQRAVQLAGNVRSTRSTTYLSDVAERLQPHHDDPKVKELYKLMSKHKIPLQRV